MYSRLWRIHCLSTKRYKASSLAIKEMGQLEVAKIWHEDDWGDGFVEDFVKPMIFNEDTDV